MVVLEFGSFSGLESRVGHSESLTPFEASLCLPRISTMYVWYFHGLVHAIIITIPPPYSDVP